MSIDVLVIRVRIHSPDEVFASCAEFAGSLDILRPSPVSCNRYCRRLRRRLTKKDDRNGRTAQDDTDGNYKTLTNHSIIIIVVIVVIIIASSSSSSSGDPSHDTETSCSWKARVEARQRAGS